MEHNKTNWLSLLALTMGILNFALICFRCEPIEANWMAILIGILTLLVTVLIGWNIYSVLELKGLVKEVKKINYRTSAHTNEGLADVYIHLLCIEDAKEYKLLQCIIDAIMYHSLIEEFSKCNRIINTFLDLDINWDALNINKNLKVEVRKHLYDIYNTERIELWQDFKNKILQITS